jgi:hypothetical protein
MCRCSLRLLGEGRQCSPAAACLSDLIPVFQQGMLVCWHALQVFPFLRELKRRLEEVAKVTPSMRSMVEVLEFLAVVLLQDAVELLSEGSFTEHPVHQLLMGEPEFE